MTIINVINSLLNFSCVSMYFLCSLSSISRLAIIACSCLSISSSMLLELLSIRGGTGGGFSLGGAFILGCPTKSLSLKTFNLRAKIVTSTSNHCIYFYVYLCKKKRLFPLKGKSYQIWISILLFSTRINHRGRITHRWIGWFFQNWSITFFQGIIKKLVYII